MGMPETPLPGIDRVEEDEEAEKCTSGKMNNNVKIILGEFLATLLFLTVALGSVAQLVLGTNTFFGICVAFALGAAIGIFTSANISGAHMNPAATVALCLNGRCQWKDMPFYWIGQYLGAFVAAALVFGTYSDGILAHDPELTVNGAINATTPTAGIFATYPAGDHISSGICFLDQVVETAILVFSILAVTDAKNKVHPSIIPIFIGLSIGAVGMSFGYNCGFSLNPARDLGPRIFTAMVYGGDVFAAHNYYFWVPVIGPYVGGALAGLVYKFGTAKLMSADEEYTAVELK